MVLQSLDIHYLYYYTNLQYSTQFVICITLLTECESQTGFSLHNPENATHGGSHMLDMKCLLFLSTFIFTLVYVAPCPILPTDVVLIFTSPNTYYV